MRHRLGNLRGLLILAVLSLASWLPFSAFGQTPAASPTATPSPAATPPEASTDGDLPTVSTDAPDDDEDEEGDDADDESEEADEGDDEEEWDNRSSASGMILGMRAGLHAYELGGLFGDGGVGVEFAGAMPVHGPFYAGGAVEYHTGYVEAGGDRESRFFEAQHFSLEGQYRRTVGTFGLMGGVGVGYLTANSALVVTPEGTELPGDSTEVTGSTVAIHLVGAAHYPITESFGVVGQLKYALAPVNFTKIEETISMGGLTIGVGMDFGF